MCGFYFANYSQTREQIIISADKIRHRGPDYTGVLNDKDMTAIHARLSIVDLSIDSNQPYVFDDLILVYNGELYNTKELKRDLQDDYDFVTNGDTEVLIYAYHKYGTDVVKHLDGMFSFVIYNKSDFSVFGARDRLGQKPFYYSVHKDKIQVSSVLSTIQVDSASLNEEALQYYLAAGHIHAPHTMFNQVHKLKAGHTFYFKPGENNMPLIQNYWDISSKLITVDTKSLIVDSIQRRCISDVKSGSFLSGGLDSTLVSYFASKKGLKDTITVSIANDTYNEYKFAKNYADHLGLNSKDIGLPFSDLDWLVNEFFEAFDEPFADNSALATLVLCKAAKNEFKMCLSGDGADELFYGYNHHKYLALVRPVFLIPKFIREIINPFKKQSIYSEILELDNLKHFIVGIFTGFSPELRELREKLITQYSFCFVNSNSVRHALALFNAAYWLESDGNVKVDRASMFYGLEVRSPFMDHRLFEVANTMSDGKKRKFGKTKIPLRTIFNELIPASMQMRGKKGFDIPIKEVITFLSTERVGISVKENLFPYLSQYQKSFFQRHLKNSQNDDKSAQVAWKYFVASRWLEKNM